jgi:hypothetical protein
MLSVCTKSLVGSSCQGRWAVGLMVPILAGIVAGASPGSCGLLPVIPCKPLVPIKLAARRSRRCEAGHIRRANKSATARAPRVPPNLLLPRRDACEAYQEFETQHAQPDVSVLTVESCAAWRHRQGPAAGLAHSVIARSVSDEEQSRNGTAARIARFARNDGSTFEGASRARSRSLFACGQRALLRKHRELARSRGSPPGWGTARVLLVIPRHASEARAGTDFCAKRRDT